MICADSVSWMESTNSRFDLVLADPPYGEFPLINRAIRAARSICDGASLFFMYPEDVVHLEATPDRVLHWVKPVSTKNTSRTYSRFVEVIALYDLHRGRFNESHWSIRTGVFTDTLIERPIHPFQKPASLIAKILHLHSNPGDIILDPFGGSGTVERVARSMGRTCVTIEIDERWAHAAS